MKKIVTHISVFMYGWVNWMFSEESRAVCGKYLQ
jgi:hypothetical protein